MEALEFLTRPVNGRITIEVPSSLDGIDVKVLVVEHEMPGAKKFTDLPKEERFQYLQNFKGTATYPDFPTNKYDVYDQ
jgi:hypothetical protein